VCGFSRRFLLHVLPRGFHRIHHYGLLASGTRKANLALARKMLNAAPPVPATIKLWNLSHRLVRAFLWPNRNTGGCV